MKIIANIATNEIIEREMTKEELEAEAKEQKIWAAENAKYEKELQAKAKAKAELLERLGITADEAKLLLA
jgi:hypothetical protein